MIKTGQISLKQDAAPLFTSCQSFVERKLVPFYCPGHKGGRTFGEEFIHSIAALDVNNLPDTDTLHCPKGAILQAEHLLAEAYGVKKSFILVGGSTLGNQASVMSCVSPGDKILVQRNAHKSIVASLIYTGAVPVWLSPASDTTFSIGHGITTKQLEAACKAHPDAKAVVLLNPTYFGTVADIKTLAEIVHRHGKLLIVDQAHGAHFHFHDALPLGAEAVQADFIVQSFHKTISALSQAAVLHVNTSRISETKVRKVLQSLQTTSPGYPIMISIDLARREMATKGHMLLEELLQISRWARNELRAIDGIELLGLENIDPEKGIFNIDETKLVIGTKKWGISGYRLMNLLINHFAIQPELAGPTYILCILSIGNTKEDLQRLVSALREIHKNKQQYEKAEELKALGTLRLDTVFKLEPEMQQTPREAFYAPSSNIGLESSLGRVASEIVTPYPPGIPILMPGEVISKEIIEFLQALKEARLPVSCSDPSLETIEVVS